MSFTEWYENNKVTLNAKRRERYAKDKDYREKILKDSQAYTKKVYGKTLQAKAKTVTYKGQSVIVYSTREVANKAGVTVRYVGVLECRGKIPAPVFEGAHRFYTRGQVLAVVAVIKGEYEGDIFKDWGDL